MSLLWMLFVIFNYTIQSTISDEIPLHPPPLVFPQHTLPPLTEYILPVPSGTTIQQTRFLDFLPSFV